MSYKAVFANLTVTTSQKTYNGYIKKKARSYIITPERITFTKRKTGKKKTRNKRPHNNQKSNNKMAGISPYLSIITLNINGLNSLIQEHRVSE